MRWRISAPPLCFNVDVTREQIARFLPATGRCVAASFAECAARSDL